MNSLKIVEKVFMRILANGLNFQVAQSGAGDHTLVFLHFFGGSSRSWDGAISLLESDFRCVAPDLRGFGGSDAPPNGYSVDENANDIELLLQKLEIEEFTLIGHSMGGKIALAVAARMPKGLQNVVLLAPSPPTPEPMDDATRKRLLEGYGKREAAKNTLKVVAHSPLSPQLREKTLDDMLRASFPAWRAWLENGSREDISARMSPILVPVAIAAGEFDSAMTPQLLKREVAARIEGATLTTIAGAAHLLPIEKPGEVAALIRSTAKI